MCALISLDICAALLTPLGIKARYSLAIALSFIRSSITLHILRSFPTHFLRVSNTIEVLPIAGQMP